MKPHVPSTITGFCIALLAGCAAGPTGGGFEARYTVARDALEDGRYDRARRAYAALIAEGGPLVPRLRLEQAHVALRDGRFADAARLASGLAADVDGAAHGAALAVQGTAQHEQARALLREGRTEAAVALLRAARAALGVVVAEHPDLDPLGAMAAREAAIAARLSRL